MALLKKRQGPKKRSVYMIFLLSYVSILLLTLSSSFVYYLRVSEQISRQTEVTKQLLLNELRNRVETSTAYAESLTNQIVFNDKILQYVKGFPSQTAQEVMALLAPVERADGILLDNFVYIRSTDEIITPTIRMKAEKFFQIMVPFEGVDYAEIKASCLEGIHFQQYLPIARVNRYESEQVLVLPFVQTIPVSRNQEPLGQAICLLDAEKIFSAVEQLHQTTGSDIYILDENEQTVLTSRDAPALDGGILSEPGSVLDTGGAMVLKQVSDNLGWKFVISTPKSLYFSENREFLLSIVAITAVYLVLGLVLVHFLTELSYRPIREISRLIAGEHAPDARNEYEAIKTTLLTQMRNDRELHSIIEAQRPIVRREMLFRLLNGEVTDYDGLAARLDAAGVRFQSGRFLVLSAEVDTKSAFFEAEGGVEESLPLARLILQNVGCELLEEHFDCYYLETGPIDCVFLVNVRPRTDIDPFPGRGGALATARGAVSLLLRFAARNFGLGVFVGVSTPHEGLRELPVCFDEARKAAEYHRLQGGAPEEELQPVDFTELGDLGSDYYFPTEMEYRLVGALKAGETGRAKQILDSVFELNTRQKGIGTEAARRLLFDIASTLSRLLDSTLLAQGKERRTEADLNKYWKSPNLQAAREDFFGLIDQFAEQQAARIAGGKTARLADSIAGYIREHIGDSSLDLNGLSREFDVTPQYISNIFKRYKEENVKDYISKLRLERAKELLRTTELPVKEIAARLGYAGEIGIIRLFKKYEGVTPGDYRNAHRG